MVSTQAHAARPAHPSYRLAQASGLREIVDYKAPGVPGSLDMR